MLTRIVSRLEVLLFGHRQLFLAVLGVATVVMAVFASRLEMSAGFDKQLPSGHEYIRTFNEYRETLFGANRLTIAVHAREGDIWNKPTLSRLLEVTDAVTYLDGVKRMTVTSLWTPNVFFTEITEDGFRAEPITGGAIVPEKLSPQIIAQVRGRTTAGGHMGSLVSRDQTSAIVTAELVDVDPATGERLDYIALNRLLEEKIRQPFEDEHTEIQIIGFAKQIGDIADRAGDVMMFFGIAFALTIMAVYWYCRSWWLTFQLIGCSVTSLVWQFGSLHLLGYTLDPLAILVPFLVFAIGVSHGVQQVNFIVRELAEGTDTYTAARRSFSGLLIPGVLALITTFVSFFTLTLIPIPMIRELAIVACIGVAYKAVTNMMMLPVVASFLDFDPEFARASIARRERQSGWLRTVARIAEPRNALLVTCGGAVLLGVSLWGSQGRHVGSLHPGAPELHADARYNLDSADIVSRFDVGLDWLTVVFAATEDREGPVCGRSDVFLFIDDFAWRMAAVPGVISTDSLPAQIKLYHAGLNEGNPKMAAVMRDARGLASEVRGIDNRMAGRSSTDCRVQGVNLFLPDHKATTIKEVVAAVKAYRAENSLEAVEIRLASGNAGVQAATNEILEERELPMMLYVYGVILLLVFLTYRDWRAMLSCCLPLTVATWIGYWFMKTWEIGLTVATLPVMVLAVGIGVDYSFYIYNRLQIHLAHGRGITDALEHALTETGVATVFTAITLSIGVATWSFSSLKFQADMGALMTFMFLVNMVMAVTLLPAFAVTLDRLIPRRGPVRVPEILKH